MDLSIIIPTYNRTKVLTQNLSALIAELDNCSSQVEVLIINDYKAHDSRPPLVNHPSIRWLNNPKQGVSSARNLGESLAKSEHLLFMDDDVMMTTGSVQAVLDFSSAHDGNVCLNCDWVYPKEMQDDLSSSSFGRRFIHLELNSLKGWMGPNSKWKENSLIANVKAASYFLYIPRKRFQMIDGYDESYPFAGFEDGDFAERLAASGTMTFLDTRFKVYHNEFDRLDPQTWLNRKKNEGATRRHSFELGNTTHRLHPNLLKRLAFHLFYSLRNPILGLTKLLDNKVSDSLIHPLLKGLEGAHIWKGYAKHRVQKTKK